MPQRIPTYRPPRVRMARARRDDTARPNAAARGYCDKAHRAWRQAVLTRDAWQCQACRKICGGPRQAHADHVVPITQGGERYDIANGQTLCVSCHGRKTRGEQEKLSAKRGKTFSSRVASASQVVQGVLPGEKLASQGG